MFFRDDDNRFRDNTSNELLNDIDELPEIDREIDDIDALPDVFIEMDEIDNLPEIYDGQDGVENPGGDNSSKSFAKTSEDRLQGRLSDDSEKLENQKKIEKQNKEIANVENGNKTLETAQEKGNYGEMKTDQDLREKGYKRISKDMVTDIDDAGHQGIDGVYYNPDGQPQYIIVDAKYGTAQLSDTLDGKQMSDNWIDKRLDEAVGKEKADEIRMEKLLDPDNVGSYVARVDESGNVAYDKLDSDGNIIEKDVDISES